MFKIKEHKQFIEKICRELRVKRFELVGSAARDDFQAERSDIDVLVEFDGLDNLFESIRQEELTKIIGKLPLDLQDDIDRATKNIVNKLMQIKIRTESTENSNKHER